MTSSNQHPRSRNANEVWEGLVGGLNVAFKRECLPVAHYMSLYTIVYNYCTSITLGVNSGQNQRDQSFRFLSSSTNPASADFVGNEMYQKLNAYVTKYVENVRLRGKDLDGENLLQFYTEEWSNFRVSSKVMHGLFHYLNRHWIKRELDEGHEGIYIIYTLAMVIWKEHMFGQMKSNVIDAVLELIKKERVGEIIEKKFVKSVVDCLVELGIDEYESTDDASVTKKKDDKEKLRVYTECFEKSFLQSTKEFYHKEASDFLIKNGSVTDYMMLVEKRLAEEENRCHLYLHLSTKPLLALCCEEVLIANRLEFFQTEFNGLLESRRDDDLRRMFTLCDRVTNGLDNLRSTLERHITKEGHTALEKVAVEAFQDARLYVKSILEVHQRYHKLVKESFNSDPGFTQALDKAASQFINKNAVTKRAPPAMANCKSAELLARYCDQLLKKSTRMPEEHEMDELISQIMILFKYIEDKDVFSKYYTKMFSKRLINELSASDETEANFISKLKDMCGYEYTTRLSKMVNDTQVSKDLCLEFKDKISNENKKKLGLEFSILVLSSGSWPSFNQMNLNLPAKLSDSIEMFTDFYNAKFNGRRLSWIYSQSRGEINAQCFSKKYVFTATTAQIASIMLFNEQDSYTMKQISDATGMDAKAAPAVIASLVKNEILKSDTDVNGEEISPETVISLNLAYSNRKVRVDLSKMAIRQEATKDNDTVHKNVEEDRKSVISACIVRIMKTRKRVSHQQLMAEVIQQLSTRFNPKVEMIKRCIGSLIEKEYMLRVDGQKDHYEYIA